MRTMIAAAALALVSTAAGAATIATGVTRIGDVGGINLQGPDAAVAGSNGGVFAIPGTDNVWGLTQTSFSSAVFEFDFDLTGWDLSTVALSGQIAVDNTVSVALNGTTFFSLPNVLVSNFSVPNSYSTSDASLFNQGGNTVVYTVADAGGPFGFRANVEVTGEPSSPSAIPLPASLPLVLAGLGALGLAGRARKRGA